MQIKPDDQQTDCFHLQGELCYSNIRDNKDRLFEMLTEQPQQLSLDLSRITDIDGAGLQLLILLKRSAKEQQKQLALLACSEVVLSSLDTCHLDAYFGDSLVSQSEVSA